MKYKALKDFCTEAYPVRKGEIWFPSISTPAFSDWLVEDGYIEEIKDEDGLENKIAKLTKEREKLGEENEDLLIENSSLYAIIEGLKEEKTDFIAELVRLVSNY